MAWVSVAVGGASLLTGVLGSKKAADAQVDASNAGIAEQRRQYDQTRQDLAPYRQIGSQAINALGGIYGYTPYDQTVTGGYRGSPLTPDDYNAVLAAWPSIRSAANYDDISPGSLPQVSPEAEAWLRQNWGQIRPAASFGDINFGTTTGDIYPQAAPAAGGPAAGADYSNFLKSPDYEFRRGEGQRDIGNSFAARGGATSGNALRALTEYNSNLAAGEFGNYFNRQAALAGIGQTATNTGVQAGQYSASNIGNLLGQGGSARASGILGQNAALQNAFGYAADAWYNRPQRRGPSTPPTRGYW